MAETGHYIEPKEVIFMAKAMAGDKEGKLVPPGFYLRLVEDALRDLSIDSLFFEGHKDIVIPQNLTMPLPEDCFNVREVYVFDGDTCSIQQSKKVWHKDNYYTRSGNGYIANDKGYNGNDPYYQNHIDSPHQDKSLVRWNEQNGVNNVLFYNVVNRNIMVSPSCKAAGAKIHIVYASTGCAVIDAPIIPMIFKTAMEDYVTEGALRFRVANEPSMIKALSPLLSLYASRLDKEGMNGSWPTALFRAKRMSDDEKRALGTYLGRGGWATGR